MHALDDSKLRLTAAWLMFCPGLDSSTSTPIKRKATIGRLSKLLNGHPAALFGKRFAKSMTMGLL
jgi:hypothetical protein